MSSARIVIAKTEEATTPGSSRARSCSRNERRWRRGRIERRGAPVLRGARIVVECLIKEGVDILFGYPGGAILHVYDELYKVQDRLRHILVRHEQGAVHAAEGYARSTGKVGVCMVTSGPGATNVVTGLANALMDSTPIVVISGQVATTLIGNDAFQEADIVGITRPCTKYNYLVKRREGPGADHQGGVLPRAQRPPGPGAHRHPEGRDGEGVSLHLAGEGRARLVQADHQGPPAAGEEGRRPDAAGRKGRALRRAAAWSTPARTPRSWSSPNASTCPSRRP